MKKISTLIIATMFSVALTAQDTVVGWTFPTGTGVDSVADVFASNNANRTIRAEGGTSIIDFSTNGATTFCAQATGWDNGNGTKFWSIKFKTNGYENLTLSSAIRSGGNNPGPRDWKVQYKISSGGTWTDLQSLVCANNWTAGAVVNLALPDTLNNQSNSIYIRWMVDSDTATDGSLIQPTGISKIDNIIILGTLITTAVEENVSENKLTIFPNPTSDILNVKADQLINNVYVYDLSGKVLLAVKPSEKNASLSIGHLRKGMYFIRIETETGSENQSFFID